MATHRVPSEPTHAPKHSHKGPQSGIWEHLQGRPWSTVHAMQCVSSILYMCPCKVALYALAIANLPLIFPQPPLIAPLFLVHTKHFFVEVALFSMDYSDSDFITNLLPDSVGRPNKPNRHPRPIDVFYDIVRKLPNGAIVIELEYFGWNKGPKKLHHFLCATIKLPGGM